MLPRLRQRRYQPSSLDQCLHSLTKWFRGGSSSRTSSTKAPPPRTTIESSGNKIQECTSEDDLFSYNAQRWLWNETEQLQHRYVKFDLKSLIRVVEEAVGSGASCIEVTKLSEGNFNKTFLVTMRDGPQVIARIPNPNAGRPHYTTASEVATMDYVRNRLQIPVPKVLAYNTHAGTNGVGAEYIIMERCAGVELGRVWDGIPGKHRVDVVRQLAAFQARMSKARFPYYGSLYYTRDIPDIKGTEVDSTFSVGPITSRSWFDDKRGELDIHRGPWKSAEEVMTAITKREISCLNTFSEFPRDRQQGIFNGPGGFHPTRASKMSVLQDFLLVFPHIMPKDDAYTSSILWHNDLHSENIFVDKSQPTKITGIIDWQGVHLSPAFLHVHYPALIEYDGPILDGFEQPKLPSNFADLDLDAKKAARALHTAQSIWALYEVYVHKEAPDLLRTLRYRDVLPCQIMALVGSTFDDGEAHVQDLLARAAEPETWAKLVGVNDHGDVKASCPLAYSEDELVKQKGDLAKWERDVELKARVIQEVGAYTGWDGAVLPDEYKDVSERLENAKERFLEAEAKTPEEREQWARAWPFRDK